MTSDHILGLDFLNLKQVWVMHKHYGKGFPKTLSRIFHSVADGSTVITDS